MDLGEIKQKLAEQMRGEESTWEWRTIDDLITEVERLQNQIDHPVAVILEMRTEVERLTPVYGAAVALRQVWRDKGHGGNKEREAHVAIQKAVDKAGAVRG